ncbi:expressed unknown protein [Seminavis robusta]|uniref:Uncharacterized protein n=1 Tax=Seminavis robusta TaxID=568900 RepID=A0A9N8HN95_9STRA|nr:expressed unknown protein [Seminavis robusta]|eukprot:Sro968_g226030.1 n/a (441) ;mRNA; r:23545-24867
MPMTKLTSRKKGTIPQMGHSSSSASSPPWLHYVIGFLVLLVSMGLIFYSLSYDLCLFVHRDGLLMSSAATTPTTQQEAAKEVPYNAFANPKLNNPLQNSTHATVMGMAFNYGVSTFKSFVGSLRRTGYQGHIILAISDVPEPGVEDYLRQQNVVMKKLKIVDCQMDIDGLKEKEKQGEQLDSHQKEVMTCAHPHNDLKIRWGRFALMKDWLEECTTCTGSVLVADVRDTYFQRDPFGPEAPPVTGLQVFEEHRKQRTTHWLVQFPVEKCKKTKIFDEVMLCSGTTIGTRHAMLRYLGDMAAEMRVWMKNPDCCCNGLNGDDQSIHNWLFYSGGLPYAKAEPNRMGLVNTVGVQGSIIGHWKRKKLAKQNNIGDGSADGLPYTSKNEEEKGRWLGEEYDQTDEQGYFLDFNGERSFIVHQFDRYGRPVDRWLVEHGPLKGL